MSVQRTVAVPVGSTTETTDGKRENPRKAWALGVSAARQDIARGDPQGHDDNQYTLKYRSSSHGLTFPMYSCHSSRFASTNRE